MVALVDIYKRIAEEGFTPELRKQIEKGTYSSKDIADLMEAMAKGNSALEARVAELEWRIGYVKENTDNNPSLVYPKLGVSLPTLASKKEAKNALKLLKEYHLKGTISDTVATEMAKAYQSRLEELAKNGWWNQIKPNNPDDFKGCALTSGAICGIGALVVAGIYVGSYLVTAEIGAAIGAVMPYLVLLGFKSDKLNSRNTKMFGSLFGGITGALCACLFYGILPDFETNREYYFKLGNDMKIVGDIDIIGKSSLGGIIGGIIGISASYVLSIFKKN